MINDPRRIDDAVDAVIVEESSPVGQWSKSGKNEIKLVPNGSHGEIDLWEITIGTLESGGSVKMENGKLEIGENKGHVTYIGNRVNGEKVGENNVVLVKKNSWHIHTTIGTHVTNNTGTMEITPNDENDFTVISNTQTPDKRSAASLSVRIVSGKESWAAEKVDSILEGEPKNEGLRIYYQDSSIDPMDGNEIFIDVNPDNTITLRQNNESMSAAEAFEITSGLKKLNIYSRPDISWNGVILTCGSQELQVNAKNGRIENVFVRQAKVAE